MAMLTFYGGVREIGGNKILIEDGDTRIFLDFGMTFAGKGRFYDEFLQPRTNNGLRDLLELGLVPNIDGVYRQDLLKIPGVDGVIQKIDAPDDSLWVSKVKSYNELLARDNKPFLDAVLVSHAHEDHFKHICLLDEKIKIYCSAVTRAIIEVSHDVGTDGFEHEFLLVKKATIATLGSSSYFPGAHKLAKQDAERVYRTFQPNDPFRVGGIEVTAFAVDHSVPGATAFLITTSDGKKIAYTGDLRFHGTRGDLTASFQQALKDSAPDVLITEGTRVSEDTADSEVSVRERCIDLVSSTSGLVMVGFAWKDITRYETMRDVAKQTGRTLIISPKLAYLVRKLTNVGGLNLQDVATAENVLVYLKRKDSMLYSEGDYVSHKHEAGYSVQWDRKDPSTVATEHINNGIKAYEIATNPSKYLLHLDFYNLNELIDLNPPAGSLYVSARSEPFNLEMELDEARLSNWFRRFQINPPDCEPVYVHASGHASRAELKELIYDLKPQAVYPIHTEHPEKFADIIPSETKLVEPDAGRHYLI